MHRMPPKFICLGALLLMALWAGTGSAYVIGEWTVVQLTDNDTNDATPYVSNGRVVWIGKGTIGGWEIFLWQDGVTTQLTDNGLSNVGPRISGDLVVWAASSSRIYSYDGTVQPLTPGSQSHQNPEVTLGAAAWLGRSSGSINHIFYFDGMDATQITTTSNQKNDVRISGSTIVWAGASANGTTDIFYYDGTDVIPLTDNLVNDTNPEVSDRGAGDFHITYRAYANGNWDIMHFDGATTVNLSNTPSIHEGRHRVCGNRTVWESSGTVWLHDGVSGNQLSPDGEVGFFPEISDSLVAWTGTYFDEIRVYDGTNVTNLTDFGTHTGGFPQVDNHMVVWYGRDGGLDDEIFMAYKTPQVGASVPEAAALQVFGASPNPFNPTTEILFTSFRTEELSVRIYDLQGRLVADLGKRIYPPGSHRVAWQGLNGRGQAVSSSVYFYVVQSEFERQTGKLTLVE